MKQDSQKTIMASHFSHAVAALSIGTCFYRPEIPKRVWVVGVLCSVVPDVDVIGFRFGIHYGDNEGSPFCTLSLRIATSTVRVRPIRDDSYTLFAGFELGCSRSPRPMFRRSSVLTLSATPFTTSAPSLAGST